MYILKNKETNQYLCDIVNMIDTNDINKAFTTKNKEYAEGTNEFLCFNRYNIIKLKEEWQWK